MRVHYRRSAFVMFEANEEEALESKELVPSTASVLVAVNAPTVAAPRVALGEGNADSQKVKRDSSPVPKVFCTHVSWQRLPERAGHSHFSVWKTGACSGSAIGVADKPGLEMQMPLGKHTRTEKGTFRRERADSLAKNLREEYPEFNKVHGNTKLGTLKKEFDVDSLNAVRRELRKRTDS